MNWSDKEREQLRARLLKIVSEFPGLSAENSHGHTGFFLRGKRIAWFLVDHHGDGRIAAWVKAPPGEQHALVSSDPVRYFVPPYLGPSGWVGIDLHADTPDWTEIHALFEQAWRMSATKKAIREFDASGSVEA